MNRKLASVICVIFDHAYDVIDTEGLMDDDGVYRGEGPLPLGHVLIRVCTDHDALKYLRQTWDVLVDACGGNVYQWQKRHNTEYACLFLLENIADKYRRLT